MLTDITDRDVGKLLLCFDSIKSIKDEKEERLKSINSLIATLENKTIVEQTQKLAKNFNSISSRTRLLILLILNQLNAFHSELEYILGLSQPTISHHVHKLINSGLIEQQKKEKIVFLSLTKLGRMFISFIKDLLRETSDILIL